MVKFLLVMKKIIPLMMIFFFTFPYKISGIEDTGFFKSNTLTRYIYQTSLKHTFIESVQGKPACVTIVGGCELIFVNDGSSALIKMKIKNCVFYHNVSEIPGAKPDPSITQLSANLEKEYIWFDTSTKLIYYKTEEPSIINFKKGIVSNFLLRPQDIDNFTSNDWILEDVRGACRTRYSKLDVSDVPQIRQVDGEYNLERLNMSKYLKTCEQNIANFGWNPKSSISLDKLKMTTNGFVDQRMKCQYEIAIKSDSIGNKKRDHVNSITCDEIYTTQLIKDKLSIKTTYKWIDEGYVGNSPSLTQVDDSEIRTQLSNEFDNLKANLTKVSDIQKLIRLSQIYLTTSQQNNHQQKKPQPQAVQQPKFVELVKTLKKSPIRFTTTILDDIYEPTTTTRLEPETIIADIQGDDWKLRTQLSNKFDNLIASLRKISDIQKLIRLSQKYLTTSQHTSTAVNVPTSFQIYLDALTQCGTVTCVGEITRLARNEVLPEKVRTYLGYSVRRLGMITNPNEQILKHILELCRYKPNKDCIYALGSLVDYYHHQTHSNYEGSKPVKDNAASVLTEALAYLSRYVAYNCSISRNNYYNQINGDGTTKILYQLAAIKAIINMKEAFKGIEGSVKVAKDLVGCALDSQNAYLVKIAATEALYDVPKSIDAKGVLHKIFKNEYKKNETPSLSFSNAQRWAAFLHLITLPDACDAILEIWQKEVTGSQLKSLISSYIKDVITSRQPFYSNEFSTDFKLRIQEKLAKLRNLPDFSDKIPYFQSRTYSTKIPFEMPFFGTLTLHTLTHVIFESSSFVPQYTVTYVIMQYGTEFYPAFEIGFHGAGRTVENLLKTLIRSYSQTQGDIKLRKEDGYDTKQTIQRPVANSYKESSNTLIDSIVQRMWDTLGETVNKFYPDLDLDFSKMETWIKKSAGGKNMDNSNQEKLQKILRMHEIYKNGNDYEPAVLNIKILGKEVNMLDIGGYDIINVKKTIMNQVKTLLQSSKCELLRGFKIMESRTIIPTYSGFSHHLLIDRVIVLKRTFVTLKPTQGSIIKSSEIRVSNLLKSQATIIGPRIAIGFRNEFKSETRICPTFQISNEKNKLALKVLGPSKSATFFTYRTDRTYVNGFKEPSHQINLYPTKEDRARNCDVKDEKTKHPTDSIKDSNFLHPSLENFFGFKVCKKQQMVNLVNYEANQLIGEEKIYGPIRIMPIDIILKTIVDEKKSVVNHDFIMESTQFDDSLRPEIANSTFIYNVGDLPFISLAYEYDSSKSYRGQVRGTGYIKYKNREILNAVYEASPPSPSYNYNPLTSDWNWNFNIYSVESYPGASSSWYINYQGHYETYKPVNRGITLLRSMDKLTIYCEAPWFSIISPTPMMSSVLKYSHSEIGINEYRNWNFKSDLNCGFNYDYNTKVRTSTNNENVYTFNGSHYYQNIVHSFGMNLTNRYNVIDEVAHDQSNILSQQNKVYQIPLMGNKNGIFHKSEPRNITYIQLDYESGMVLVTYTRQSLFTTKDYKIGDDLKIRHLWDSSIGPIEIESRIVAHSKDGIKKLLNLDHHIKDFRVDSLIEIVAPISLGHKFGIEYKNDNNGIQLGYTRQTLDPSEYIGKLLGHDNLTFEFTYPVSRYSAQHESEYLLFKQTGVLNVRESTGSFDHSFETFKTNNNQVDEKNNNNLSQELYTGGELESHQQQQLKKPGGSSQTQTKNYDAYGTIFKLRTGMIKLNLDKTLNDLKFTLVYDLPILKWNQNLTATNLNPQNPSKLKLKENSEFVIKDEPDEIDRITTSTIFQGRMGNWFEKVDSLGVFNVDISVIDDDKTILFEFKYKPKVGSIPNEQQKSYCKVKLIEAYGIEFNSSIHREVIDILNSYERVLYTKIGKILSDKLLGGITKTMVTEIISSTLNPYLDKVYLGEISPWILNKYLDSGFIKSLIDYYEQISPERYFAVLDDNDSNVIGSVVAKVLPNIPFRPQPTKSRCIHWHPFEWHNFRSLPKNLNIDTLLQYLNVWYNLDYEANSGGHLKSMIIPKPKYAYRTAILYGEAADSYYVTFDGLPLRIPSLFNSKGAVNNASCTNTQYLLVSDINGTFALTGSSPVSLSLHYYLAGTPGQQNHVLKLQKDPSNCTYQVAFDGKIITRFPYKIGKLRVVNPEEFFIKFRVPGLRVGCNSLKMFCYIKIGHGLHGKVVGLFGNRNYEPGDDNRNCGDGKEYCNKLNPHPYVLARDSLKTADYAHVTRARADHQQNIVLEPVKKLMKNEKACRVWKILERASTNVLPVNGKSGALSSIGDIQKFRSENGDLMVAGDGGNVCEELYLYNILSDLSDCFTVVDPTSFYVSCLHALIRSKCDRVDPFPFNCQSIWAYRTLCRSYDIELKASHECTVENRLIDTKHKSNPN